MRFSPRATRAEINDIATAVFDYADAVMLSAETASGEYPLEAVQVMAATINASENSNEKPLRQIDEYLIKNPIAYSIATAVSSTDQMEHTKTIFAVTTSGYTAGLISNLFPIEPIIALCTNPKTMNQFTLFRSVYALTMEGLDSFDEVLKEVNRISLDFGLADKNSHVIITGGFPLGKCIPTNFMIIHEVK